MEQLNQYLKTLISADGYELHLEPNKNPYMIAAGGQSDVANTPLQGTQISTMVFPLIPPDVKQDLPNLPTIQFVHPHNLGKFNFTIQKSPSGFNVTISPLLGDPLETDHVDLKSKDVAGESADLLSVESSSAGMQRNVSYPVETPAVSNLKMEDRRSTPKIEIESEPVIEVISANDPQFQTVFSDTSSYEPPGRRQDFEVETDVSTPPVQQQARAERAPVRTTVPPDVVLPSMDRRATDRRNRT